MTKKNFLSHIAGLRGLAIIFVILFHLDGKSWAHGYLGVDVFLVITGYLLFLSKQGRTGYDSIKDTVLYLLKRIRRIVPPMVITILLSVIVGAFLLWWEDDFFVSKLGMKACLAKANIFLMREFEDYFAQDSAFIPLLHLWYLSVTLQVYLLWAVGNYLLQRLSKGIKISILILIGLASLGYCYSFPIHEKLKEWGMPIWDQTEGVSYYQTLPRIWEILAGGLICCLPTVRNKVWCSILSGVGLLAIIYFAFIEDIPGGGYIMLS